MIWQDHALDHALEDAPRESCGLLVRIDGCDVYRPCRNRATEPDRFAIDLDDWCLAENLGEVIGIVHSHPNATAHPSPADVAACNASGVPWHIVGLPDGVWTRTEPAVAPLVGRSFAHGVQDCYSLIRDYYGRHLGITLPDFLRRDGWWDGEQAEDLYREHFAKAGFREIDAADAREHDVVVMQVRSTRPNHGGVLLDGGLILHHLIDRLSAREVFGGYWRKHAVLWLRHESNPDPKVFKDA